MLTGPLTLEELSVLENVLLPLCWRSDHVDLKQLEKQACELLGQVGLADKLHVLPSRLSLGERQRVAVVRALLQRPKLVLADEPTASLDKANGELVLSLLKQLCQQHNTALLSSTHDESIKAQFSKRYNIRGCCYE